ncbi:protein kinase [Actinomadura graeca]|uniref:Protein kinase n=1 Tax=Actinomadura graeca TaxID=2750812 RepID=A0ABX8R1M0_9ACTN|nr:serine/threonine-protein kinase [Actinomadura graeca]QXJ24768.1 protein kinase [Actinomadura graeca]
MPVLPLDRDDPRSAGDYRLTGRLGEGGQGVVYLGEGPSGERVAVKMLKTTDSAARARFAREMRAAQQVAAFCTAAVLDSSADGELPYVVSEFIDGPSLQQRVQEHGPLRGGELERLAVNTASALAAIHGAGIVHRDLKPANVLLGPDGPRVVDFGIARAIDAETHTQLVGTPAYFAPEWLDGHPPTDRSDVFAWAGTMVFAATGHPPFGPTTSVAATMHRIANGAPDLGGVPPSLLPLLAECLAKDPAGRPAARELMVRLVDPSAGPPTVPGPSGAPVPSPVPPSFPPPVPSPGQAAPTLPPVPLSQTAAPTADPTVVPAAGRRRGRLAVAVAVPLAALVMAGAAAYALTREGEKPPQAGRSSAATASDVSGQKSATPGPSATRPSGTAAVVPAEFGGTWKGTLTQTGGITTGDSSTTATLRLEGGTGGGTSEYATWGCEDTLAVTSVSGSTVVFQETPRTSDGTAGFCIGGTVTLKLVSGTLEYTSPGVGTTRGTLRRAG